MNKSNHKIISGYLNIFLDIIKMWKTITTGYHLFMFSKKGFNHKPHCYIFQDTGLVPAGWKSNFI